MAAIDLNLLPIFVAVAETSSFSAAAAKLGIPKSTISRGVASLEDAMGVRLFHRTTRQVSLSTAGDALLERSAPLLAALQQSVSDLPELQEQPSGVLRVTSPIDFGSAVLADLVAKFTARYSALQIDLRLSNAVVDIVAEGFDVAFRISSRPLKDSSLVAQKVGTVALQLYAAPSYVARRGLPRVPEELDGHAWVGFRGTDRLRLTGSDKAVTVEPRGRIVCDDMFFVQAALRAGAGIGALPNFVAAADVAAGNLVCALPRWSGLAGQLWLVSPGGRHPPRKVTAFRDFAMEALRNRLF